MDTKHTTLPRSVVMLMRPDVEGVCVKAETKKWAMICLACGGRGVLWGLNCDYCNGTGEFEPLRQTMVGK